MSESFVPNRRTPLNEERIEELLQVVLQPKRMKIGTDCGKKHVARHVKTYCDEILSITALRLIPSSVSITSVSTPVISKAVFEP